MGELGRRVRSCPFATLIGASERARKVAQNAPISVSNGHDLTLLLISPILLTLLLREVIEWTTWADVNVPTAVSDGQTWARVAVAVKDDQWKDSSLKAAAEQLKERRGTRYV